MAGDVGYSYAGYALSQWTVLQDQLERQKLPWARRDAAGNVHYLFGDQIGSARTVTNSSGVSEDNAGYYPYGQPTTFSSFSSGNLYKFTGRELDAESGNDYFEARYYASTMGRWMSPDWSATAEPVPYAKLNSPQSLNLYSYVLNNPLRQVDPDGHVGLPGNSGSPEPCAAGAGSSICNPQNTAPAHSAQKSNSAASSISPAGRIALGIVGLANLWDALQRADFTVAATVGLVEAPPAAVAVALYGTTSVVGQGGAGAAQIAQAVTGTNAARPIEQAGNILAGPISGGVTILLGRSREKAEENANWESFATGGAGLVNHREPMFTRIVEFTLGLFGVNPH